MPGRRGGISHSAEALAYAIDMAVDRGEPVTVRYLPRAKVAPPSTGITVPVTYRPAREDR